MLLKRIAVKCLDDLIYSFCGTEKHQDYRKFSPKRDLGWCNVLFPVSSSTQGVLSSKFPISIQSRPWGTIGIKKVQKILTNHAAVSNFARMLLNLRNTQKSQKLCKKTLFFLTKFNLLSKEHFSGYFLFLLDVCIEENIYLT